MDDGLVRKISRKQPLWKVRGGSFFRRSYYIDVNRNALVFDSSKLACVSGSGGTAVPLGDITEVRSGWQTDNFNRLSRSLSKRGANTVNEEKCFSIVYGDGAFETLDLIANSEEQRDDWVRGLKRLTKDDPDCPFDGWLMDMFCKADQDQSGALNFQECCQLLTKMKVEINKDEASQLFIAANENDDNGEKDALDSKEFVTFYHSLINVPEIFEALFKKYSSDPRGLNLTELLNFLHKEQNVTHLNEKTASRLLQQYERSNIKDESLMSVDGFSRMLQAPVFSGYNDYHQNTVHQDMSQPLAHYYISSSHNTYLIGDQLTGASSVEGYMNALKRGCKLVEIDLHDGEGGEPKVTHGKTFTSKIYLRDVLEDAIKPNAFKVSPYPLILSIENHLSINGQKKMIELFKEIIGEHLLLALDTDFEQLPSPDELKNKIIIKAKKPKGQFMEEDSEESNDEQTETDSLNRTKLKKLRKIKHLTPELREIVNVCEGKKFATFSSSFNEDKCVHFPSIKEHKALNLLKETPEEFVEFTQKQILKIYPQGRRVNSSNIKPYPLWSVGVQVVALNMQTNDDKPNFYNDGLFRSNGNCGYVLKPDILLNPSLYDPRNLPQGLQETVIRVRIISGQNLVKRPDVHKVSPYVQVKTRGHDLDKQKFKTKTIEKNGLDPIWDEVFDLHIKVASISIIYFQVQDDVRMGKNNILASLCIPFASLTTGYRTVHLNDTKGRKLAFASLFVHIEDITTDDMSDV